MWRARSLRRIRPKSPPNNEIRISGKMRRKFRQGPLYGVFFCRRRRPAGTSGAPWGPPLRRLSSHPRAEGKVRGNIENPLRGRTEIHRCYFRQCRPVLEKKCFSARRFQFLLDKSKATEYNMENEDILTFLKPTGTASAAGPAAVGVPRLSGVRSGRPAAPGRGFECG